jgi:hypothetical protein
VVDYVDVYQRYVWCYISIIHITRLVAGATDGILLLSAIPTAKALLCHLCPLQQTPRARAGVATLSELHHQSIPLSAKILKPKTYPCPLGGVEVRDLVHPAGLDQLGRLVPDYGEASGLA